MPSFFKKVASKSDFFIALFGHPNSWGKGPLEQDFDTTQALLENFGLVENEEIAERLHQEEMKEMKNKVRRRIEKEQLKKSLQAEEQRALGELATT